MSLLFDIPSEEPKKRRPVAAPKTPEEPVLVPIRKVQSPPLGRIEDVHACPDDACGSGYHEIAEEDGGFWRLECLFCGTGQWVKAIRGYLKPKEAEFTFSSGDYAGLTIGAVWEDERGRGYVEWAAEEHPKPAVRAACKKHLDALASVR